MGNVSMINGHIDEPKGLTDEDVVKALMNLKYGGHSCKTCKYDAVKREDRCGLKGCYIAKNALDLINRLKADKEALINGQESLMKHLERKKEIITELDKEVERLKNILKNGCELSRCINKGWIKSEAVKEFAETVYRFFCQTSNWNNLKDAILFNGECDWLKENLENLVEIRVGGEADV